jgi:hypothetical protein
MNRYFIPLAAVICLGTLTATASAQGYKATVPRRGMVAVRLRVIPVLVTPPSLIISQSTMEPRTVRCLTSRSAVVTASHTAVTGEVCSPACDDCWAEFCRRITVRIDGR